jgi:hypothetical protein
MKALWLIALPLCLAAVPCLAQPGPDTLWTRTYGGSNNDCASSVQQTAEGGYIVAGYTKSFGVGTLTYPNMWLVKTNSQGDTLWTRTYGGTSEDQASSVAQTSGGGYIVAGNTKSYGAGIPTYSNFYLVKTNSFSPRRGMRLACPPSL